MIKLNNVNKYYNKNKKNEIHVINNTSLELPDTGLVTFLGQSGSGKTTLLNVIGGLDKSTGVITYDSTEIKNYNMSKVDKYRRENVGYVFQNYNLLNDITVYDNLAVALEAIDIVDKEEVKKRIEYSLKAVGMYKFRRKLAFALSGGQQQRVSIARALVKNSKVIIADEPTGNLDSENSIEIMRILKAISKKSLVLLVTHDKSLAEFYSDTIIELKDGIITNKRTKDTNASLDGLVSDNEVYLGDMTLSNVKSDFINVSMYHNDENPDAIELRIIKKNGQYYLSSNKPIKMLDQSPLKINEGKLTKDTIKTKEEEFVYDTSFYKDKKYNNVWNRLWTNILFSLKRFFYSRKRSKIFHIIFFVIGITLGILNVNFQTYYYNDTSKLNYSEDYSRVILGNYYDQKDKVNNKIIKAYNDGLIDKLAVNYGTLEFRLEYNSVLSVNRYYQGLIADYDDVKSRSLIAGRAPTSFKEVAIGKRLADSLLQNFGKLDKTYESLFSGTLTGDNTISKIVGVVDIDSSFAYYSPSTDDVALSLINGYYIENNTGYYKFENENYTIIDGVDVDPNTTNECIVTSEYLSMYGVQIGDYISISSMRGSGIHNYIIKGVFQSKDENYKPYNVLTNDEDAIYEISQTLPVYLSVSDPSNYKLELGTNVTTNGECVAPIYSGVKIGDMYYGFKVVGLYSQNGVRKTKDIFSTIYVSKSNVLLYPIYCEDHYVNCDFYFACNDINALKTRIGDFEIVNSKDYAVSVNAQANKEARATYIPVMIVLSIIILVYIYFTTRSSMLQDIYSIGVYRSLGYSRKRIVGRYAVQIAVQTIFTSFIGYLLSLVVYEGIANKLNKLGFDMTTVFDKPTTYLFMLLFLGLAILIGLIPIATLLVKTPSEITSKYDI